MRGAAVIVMCSLAVLLAVVAEPVMAAKVVDVSGTSWYLQLKEKERIQGLGGEKEMGVALLHIGPNAGKGISADQVKVEIPGEGEMVFDCVIDDKGRVEMVFAPGELEAMIEADIEEVLEDNFTTVEDVSVQIVKQKQMVKAKPGKKAKLVWVLKFIVSATLDGQPMELKVVQSIKGKGVPLL